MSTRQELARTRYAQVLREATARYAPKQHEASGTAPMRRRRLGRLLGRPVPA